MKAGLSVWGMAPIYITNKHSGITNPATVAPVSGLGAVAGGYGNALATLSGAVTSGVYKELLNLTGAGIFDICGLVGTDTTIREIALKLTIDDEEEAFEGATTISSSDAGILGIGMGTGISGGVGPQPTIFKKNFVAYVKDNHTGTDFLRLVTLWRRML